RGGGLEPEALYARCATLGLEYGASLQGVSGVMFGEGQLLAELRVPATAMDVGKYGLHPSLLDGALQAAVGLMDAEENTLHLPFALERLRVHSPCSQRMWAWIRIAQNSAQIRKLDIDLCDERGEVCLQMQGLVLRSSPTPKERTIEVGVVEARPAQTAIAPEVREEERGDASMPRAVLPRRIDFGAEGQSQHKANGDTRAKPSGLMLRAPSVLQLQAKRPM